MKPMLFNTEMVRAVLDGRKTVTRRVVKRGAKANLPCQPGDMLYVRETWQFVPCIDCDLCLHGACSSTPVTYEDQNMIGDGCFIYRADYPERERVHWLPSIHMPKKAARIFLEVTDVRAERLQDITAAECVREGIPHESLAEAGEDFTVGQFHDLWDSIFQPSDLPLYGWKTNPWVWVIEFMRVTAKEANHG